MNTIDASDRGRDGVTRNRRRLGSVQLSPACPMCEAFLAAETAAGREPHLGHLAGLGAAVVIAQGYPDPHYGFRARREGNACPRCHRRIVSIEDGPRSHGWKTYLELRGVAVLAVPPLAPTPIAPVAAPPVAATPAPAVRREVPRRPTPRGGIAAPRVAPTSAEWTLTSISGPARWRMGPRERRTRRVASVDGATLRLAVRDTIVSLDWEGRSVRATRTLGRRVALSGTGRYAASIEQRRLRVLELETGITTLETDVRSPKAKLVWSHDASRLAVDDELLDVATGARVRLGGPVLALSNDGALAVVRRGAPVVVDLRGSVVRELPGAAAYAWQLAWSGRALALAAPDTTVIADLDTPARDVVIDHLGGHVLALDATSGRFLVGGEHGAAICEPAAEPRRLPDVHEPFAISPDGQRALVWVGSHLERLELASGARTSVGDATPDPIRALLADPRGEGVFVQTEQRAVYLWDPQRETRLRDLARCGGLQAVSPDGTSLLAVDEGGHVTLASRDGTVRWRTSIRDTPATEARPLVFEDAHVHHLDERLVTLHVAFSASAGDDPDAPPVRAVQVERVLRLEDGARVRETTLSRPTLPALAAWRIDRDQVLVAGATVPLGRELGDVTAALLSSDGRGLLVGTSLGLLLRLNRGG